MLLFPILRLLQWAVDGSLQSRDSAAVVIALLATNAITFYERVNTPNDVWFFWVPMAVGAVYAFAWYRRHATSPLVASTKL
jgi:hypothetical protein